MPSPGEASARGLGHKRSDTDVVQISVPAEVRVAMLLMPNRIVAASEFKSKSTEIDTSAVKRLATAVAPGVVSVC